MIDFLLSIQLSTTNDNEVFNFGELHALLTAFTLLCYNASILIPMNNCYTEDDLIL